MSAAEHLEPGEAYYRAYGWSGFAGSDWSTLPPATKDGWRHAEERLSLRDLIREHGSHGFAGVMRARTDGCAVYVAAVALDDALRAAECHLSPERGDE